MQGPRSRRDRKEHVPGMRSRDEVSLKRKGRTRGVQLWVLSPWVCFHVEREGHRHFCEEHRGALREDGRG